MHRIEGQQDDRPTRHPAHLRQTRRLVGPVMDRVHRHGGVEGIIRERQRLGASLHHGRRRKRALADHPDGRLDGGNGPSGGLVGPGTRADIEDRTSIAQRILYHRADPGIGLAQICVIHADHVV